VPEEPMHTSLTEESEGLGRGARRFPSPPPVDHEAKWSPIRRAIHRTIRKTSIATGTTTSSRIRNPTRAAKIFIARPRQGGEDRSWPTPWLRPPGEDCPRRHDEDHDRDRNDRHQHQPQDQPSDYNFVRRSSGEVVWSVVALGVPGLPLWWQGGPLSNASPLVPSPLVLRDLSPTGHVVRLLVTSGPPNRVDLVVVHV
jgi:hypothetical protein